MVYPFEKKQSLYSYMTFLSLNDKKVIENLGLMVTWKFKNKIPS